MGAESASDATRNRAGDSELNAARGVHRLLSSGQYFKARRGSELGLGPSDLAAMGHLYFEGPQAPGELSAWMGVTSGTMTALLRRVEKAGFLRRDPNPQDRRGVVVSLSPAGSHAMQWFYEQLEEIIGESLTGLSEHEVQQVHTAVDRLAGSLCARAGHPASADRTAARSGARRP